MVHCSTQEARPHLVACSEALEDALPGAKTLRRMMYALWSTQYCSEPPVHPSTIEDETRYLHFDFTYCVMSGILVNHNGKRVELSYTLGQCKGPPACHCHQHCAN